LGLGLEIKGEKKIQRIRPVILGACSLSLADFKGEKKEETLVR